MLSDPSYQQKAGKTYQGLITDKSIEYSVKKERKEEKISVNLLVIYDFLVLLYSFNSPKLLPRCKEPRFYLHDT